VCTTMCAVASGPRQRHGVAVGEQRRERVQLPAAGLQHRDQRPLERPQSAGRPAEGPAPAPAVASAPADDPADAHSLAERSAGSLSAGEGHPQRSVASRWGWSPTRRSRLPRVRVTAALAATGELGSLPVPARLGLAVAGTVVLLYLVLVVLPEWLRRRKP
jgi:hypothetical protein